MDNVELIIPSIKFKDQILDYKKEFEENQESIDGSSDLDLYNSFEEWYQNMNNLLRGQNLSAGVVPATTYLAVVKENENSKVVGMITIRHRLNPALIVYGGHVGYSVRNSERGKGYGTQMLKEALRICQDMRLNNILLTCIKGNLASEKIIKSNGGFFERELPYNDTSVKQYWINVDKQLAKSISV